MDEAEVQELVDLRSQGMSLRKIGAATGYNKNKVLRVLQDAEEHGILPTKKTDSDSSEVSRPETETGHAGQTDGLFNDKEE